MADFRKLRVWREGHRLGVAIHAILTVRSARCSPGVRAQILRAANSIPTTSPKAAPVGSGQWAVGSGQSVSWRSDLGDKDCIALDRERHVRLVFSDLP